MANFPFINMHLRKRLLGCSCLKLLVSFRTQFLTLSETSYTTWRGDGLSCVRYVGFVKQMLKLETSRISSSEK